MNQNANKYVNRDSIFGGALDDDDFESDQEIYTNKIYEKAFKSKMLFIKSPQKTGEEQKNKVQPITLQEIVERLQ